MKVINFVLKYIDYASLNSVKGVVVNSIKEY